MTQNQRPSLSVAVYPMNGINLSTGYGLMEAGLIYGLQEAGIHVRVNWSQPGDIAIWIGDPHWVERHGSMAARNWLFTMSESTRVSQKWVDTINEQYERVLVPAPDLVRIYEQSGVTVPVHFVPLGIDFQLPEFVERDPNPENFTFLTYSLGDMRKGVELAIFAFLRQFKDDMRYKLVIKCRDNPGWIGGLQDPQIEFATGETSADAWYKLLYEAHAFIFPSRGEGFGYPPRLATLTGLPSVATQWLGMWDVDQWGYPIPVKEMRPAQFYPWDANAEGSLWAEPEADSRNSMLDIHLSNIASNYPRALEKAQQGRAYLLNNFRWEHIGNSIAGLLRRYNGGS